MIQTDDYYPFGGTFNSYVSGDENLYKFNGMEEQKETETYLAVFRDYDPWLGRWQQIDPKANEFHSPYAGMGNNPILFSDPLGDTIRVKFGGFLGIGRKTVNVDENGAITNTDGSKYEGKVKGFLKKTVNAVNELSNGSTTANSFLAELSSSENVFTIVRGNGKNQFVSDNKQDAYAWMGKSLLGGQDNTGNGGSGGTIFWSPGSGKTLLQDGTLSKNSTMNLAHELLGHGLDANRGESNSDVTNGLSNNEWQASYTENIIRGEMNLQYRAYYRRTNTGVGLPPKLLDSYGKPIQPTGFSPLNKSWYKAYLRR